MRNNQQVDLGFRSFVSEPEMITCPKCGHKHDAYKTCEKCGWTCSKTFNELSRRQQEQIQEQIQKWLQAQQAQTQQTPARQVQQAEEPEETEHDTPGAMPDEGAY